jgi:Ser/Thr protein kinase RdoA (MazF antagonist)
VLPARVHAAWPGLDGIERLPGGQRNEVWSATREGTRVVVRRSRRSPASLRWELDLLVTLAGDGIHVPQPIPTSTGELHHGAFVVQPWVEGRPPSGDEDWQRVAAELARVHALPTPFGQRPASCVVTELGTVGRSVDVDLATLPADVRTLVVDVFDSFADAPVSLVHGDPGPGNVRIDADGVVWLLDWDESRIDVTWHDLSNLGVPVLDDDARRRAEMLSNAWEAVNAWVLEPDYARTRLAALQAQLA